MLLATQGIFMHNERFYKQVEGIIMGNQLGPTMANFCMAHLEEKIFAVSLTRFLIATKTATSFFRF